MKLDPGIATKEAFFFSLLLSSLLSLSLSLSLSSPPPTPTLHYCLLLCHMPAGEKKMEGKHAGSPPRRAHGRQQSRQVYLQRAAGKAGLSADQRGRVFEKEPKASAEEQC